MSMAIASTPGLPVRRPSPVRGVLRLLFGIESAGAAPGPARPGLRLLRGGRKPAEDRPTLTELYHAHRLGLVRMAVLLVDRQDIAEDVVQEAFTALYQRHGEHLDDLDNALGHLRTSVVNGARSVLRRRKTAREYVPPHEADARRRRTTPC